MKKTYKSIKTFIVLLSLVAFQMGAQISGVVTINSAAATGGTNYQNFTALATALNTSGINGPLTVNVVSASGPYVEQPTFNAITGASATNTITINGNGNVLSFNSTNSAAPWTLLLNGTDYMSVNGLNIWAQGTTYAMACILTGGADYNTFSSCTFSCPANSTSSSHGPFLISSTNNSFSGGTNSGNFNSVTTCTAYNGYYGMFVYGYTGAPYQSGNSVTNCLISDFYYMGIYYPYQKNPTIKKNIIQRPTRTSSTTTYGMYGYYCQGALVDGNWVRNLFDGNQTSTSTCYGMMVAYNAVGGGANRNIVKNNIVSDIKHNGTVYGIQAYYLDGDLVHNIVSLDHTTSTGGTAYGLYPYGGSGYAVNILNNIVSITKGGTGSKYGIYFAGVTGNVVSNYNDIYVNSTGGTNYPGYYSAAATSSTAYQSQGVDANSFFVDPVYTSIVAQNYIPTATSMNNTGTPALVYSDFNNNPRSSVTPDIGAFEFLSIQCAGTPSANTVVSPTYAICPGNNVNLGLATYYSDLGITYQWQSSTTSSVGPWTSVSGATNVQYATPGITVPTWYSVVMTCTNGGGFIQPVGYVNVAGTTTNTVPYYENFDQISGAGKLPNCSWAASSLGGSCLTYTSSNTLGRTPRSGNSFASFYYNPSAANYFYTNGIYLDAGVTYSAALWYQTEYYGYNNWTDLSILYGTTQTSVGLVSIASTNGPAISNIYKSLSNTFTVATSGLYYIAVRGTGNTSSSAQYLTWDDLSITIPCSLNSPTMNISVNSATVCAGDQVSFSATGADTYTWSTGATGSSLNDNPLSSTNYMVVGTSSLSGCSTTLTQMVSVNPAPSIYVYAASNSVCAGQSANLTAFGASSYTWNTGAFSPNISVSPTSNTSYSVTGSNANGCIGTAVQAIVVNPLPTITVNSSAPNEMCSGETQVLTAGGNGVTFQWIVGTTGMIMAGNPVNINPTATTIYTVTATGANGCVNKSTITQNVSDCVGLKENKLNGVKVYPNPTAGEFTVELNNTLDKTVQVTDIAGRIISTTTSNQSAVKVNISNLANGIYYVKIQSNNSTEVIKVVKN